MLNNAQIEAKNSSSLPQYFKHLMWSYDFSAIDLQKNKKAIVVNTINYGDLRHWRWIVWFYGKEGIRNVLSQIPATEIRSRARRLVSIVFNIDKFNYAPRGSR
jgi:hypothetical protein